MFEYQVEFVDGFKVRTFASTPEQAKKQVLANCAPYAPDSAVKSVTAAIPRFKPFPPVPCGYGAPMGRSNGRADLTDDTDLCVAGPAGEYDAGGAYWGYSPSEGPIWAVWERGRGHDGVVYVRTHNRDDAKLKACA